MQAAEGLHATGGRELQAKLKELVRHIRENKLRMTFTDALGRAQSQPDGINSQKEARRLAFYLFWNVRTEYDRQLPTSQSPMLPGNETIIDHNRHSAVVACKCRKDCLSPTSAT